MSEFNNYARKMDEIARAAFDEYSKAADRERRAEDARRQYPQRQGVVSADYAATSARAQADYLEAVQGREAVRRKMDEGDTDSRLKPCVRNL
jgi:hypothetical protein